jgi:exodeoxyribonuclease III
MAAMKIATWNVNSVKVRLEGLLTWLKQAEPDVVCLQEIKTTDETFPQLELAGLGYNIAIHGQKTYNGVAILSKPRIEDVSRGLPGDPGDTQARYIEAVIGTKRPVRVASLYLPNGNPLGTDKYHYKLAWMERLKAHARALLALEEPLVLAGDYNVIPRDGDAWDPALWRQDALFALDTRMAFASFTSLGFTDALRACHPEPGLYSFWDYQQGAWQKNWGIRIDHLMLSPQAADRLKASGIDKAVRAWEQPSDHVPVWCELED